MSAASSSSGQVPGPVNSVTGGFGHGHVYCRNAPDELEARLKRIRIMLDDKRTNTMAKYMCLEGFMNSMEWEDDLRWSEDDFTSHRSEPTAGTSGSEPAAGTLMTCRDVINELSARLAEKRQRIAAATGDAAQLVTAAAAVAADLGNSTMQEKLWEADLIERNRQAALERKRKREHAEQQEAKVFQTMQWL
jgi:hypothetical protein